MHILHDHIMSDNVELLARDLPTYALNNPNVVDPDGRSLLYVAVFHAKVACVEMLLSNPDIITNYMNYQVDDREDDDAIDAEYIDSVSGCSILHVALWVAKSAHQCRENDDLGLVRIIAVIHMLMRDSRVMQACVHHVDEHNMNPLMYACTLWYSVDGFCNDDGIGRNALMHGVKPELVETFITTLLAADTSFTTTSRGRARYSACELFRRAWCSNYEGFVAESLTPAEEVEVVHEADVWCARIMILLIQHHMCGSSVI